MAAAVVTGIILGLAAMLFNFSVHKIDEGERRVRNIKTRDFGCIEKCISHDFVQFRFAFSRSLIWNQHVFFEGPKELLL